MAYSPHGSPTNHFHPIDIIRVYCSYPIPPIGKAGALTPIATDEKAGRRKPKPPLPVACPARSSRPEKRCARCQTGLTGGTSLQREGATHDAPRFRPWTSSGEKQATMTDTLSIGVYRFGNSTTLWYP
jgi:hypothetical protein